MCFSTWKYLLIYAKGPYRAIGPWAIVRSTNIGQSDYICRTSHIVVLAYIVQTGYKDYGPICLCMAIEEYWRNQALSYTDKRCKMSLDRLNSRQTFYPVPTCRSTCSKTVQIRPLYIGYYLLWMFSSWVICLDQDCFTCY